MTGWAMLVAISACAGILAAPACAAANQASAGARACGAATYVAQDILAHRERGEVIVGDASDRSLNQRFLRKFSAQGIDLSSVRRTPDDPGGWQGRPPEAALVSMFLQDGFANAAKACPHFTTLIAKEGALLIEPKGRRRGRIVSFLRVSGGALNAAGSEALISVESGCGRLCGGGGRLLHLHLQSDGDWKTVGVFPIWMS